MASKNSPLWLVIDKSRGCLLTTPNPSEASSMYEVADGLQWMTNKPVKLETESSTTEIKKLHALFQAMWEIYIFELDFVHVLDEDARKNRTPVQ